MNLTLLVPPPAMPREAEGEWLNAEQELSALPSDYKELIRVYGTGCFDDFIWVLNPFSEQKHLNLLEQVRLARRAYESLRDEFHEPQPFQFFPEKAGLLPFAITDNGDYLNWRTEGMPDQWCVVVSAGREPEYEVFDCSASKFLEGVLSGSLACKIFPADFPSANLSFRSKG